MAEYVPRFPGLDPSSPPTKKHIFKSKRKSCSGGMNIVGYSKHASVSADSGKPEWSWLVTMEIGRKQLFKKIYVKMVFNDPSH
jgi:hypothetical protein